MWKLWNPRLLLSGRDAASTRFAQTIQRLTYRKSTNEIDPSLHYTSERAHIVLYINFDVSEFPNIFPPLLFNTIDLKSQ